MRVIGYLESSFWTMRGIEFGTMMRRAYAHADKLDSVLTEAERQVPQAMLAKPGNRMDGTRYVQVRDGVAVIDVNGVIAKRMNLFEEMCNGGTSTEILLRDFSTAVENPNVESIVINIDSPGGEAFGINEFAQAVYDARGKKPIKAYVSGLGCSGAYWIASAADEVIIDKSAFVGSIGVVTAWMDDKEFYKMLGIRREVVTSTNAPFKRLDFDNEEHRQELQRELDSIESVFIRTVARNRKVTVDQVKKDFNQGGVLLGADAVKAAMADRVGSLESVIKGLKTKGSKTIASFGANSQGEITMNLMDKVKEFFSSDEIKPLLEQGKEYAVIERPAAHAAAEPGTDDAKPADEGTKPPADDANPPAAEPAKPASEPDTKPAIAPAEPPASNEVDAVRTELFATQATAFVDAEVRGGRLFPAEKATFQSVFVQAAVDDFRSPLAEGSRVENLKAQQAARKPHGLTKEQVSGQDNELFILGLGNSTKTQLDKDVESQIDSYVATVQPKAKLEAVK